MDTGIIIALIFGIASIVSSFCFGFIPAIRRAKLDRLEKKAHTMAQDIDSFYAIELILLEKLSDATGKNVDTLKKEVREQVRRDKNRSLSFYAKPSVIVSEL